MEKSTPEILNEETGTPFTDAEVNGPVDLAPRSLSHLGALIFRASSETRG